MNIGWREIGTDEVARELADSVCWEDSSLTDAIFCHTVLMLKGKGRRSGYGLRLLVDCCSAPASHLELVFLDITDPVPMPVSLGHFSACLAGNGHLRFGFGPREPAFTCRMGCFRFIELTSQEAKRLYRSPSILEPAEGRLSTEGCVAFETCEGGQVVVSGRLDSPKLFVQAKGYEGSEVRLDGKSACQLLDAVHFAGTSDLIVEGN